MAMQMAVGKERLNYFSAFIGLLYVVLPIAAVKHHTPQAVLPLVPLSILWCFQYDMYYGSLMIRAQREASRTIKDEPERFFLPPGTGIVEQAKYNEIIGVAEDYKPSVTEKDSLISYIQKSLHGGN